jgi:hypothetical protein
MVAKLGLPSPDSALYRLSRPIFVCLESCVIPRALAIKAASSPASSTQALKY